MSDNAKIMDKIKKCLALSTSANEHEAASALRQARKLMEAYGITGEDVQAAEAEERRAKAGAKTQPANWEAMLAVKIGDVFGCQVIFSGHWSRKGEWCFIGCGSAPEISQYAFAVLHRQAKRAREEYIKAQLKRCKAATKTRRADLFSDGWVRAVVCTIVRFAGDEQQSAAIKAYIGKHHPVFGKLATCNRNTNRTLRDHEYRDFTAGQLLGREAQLNRGVGGADQQRAIEVAP